MRPCEYEAAQQEEERHPRRAGSEELSCGAAQMTAAQHGEQPYGVEAEDEQGRDTAKCRQ
jgi:hypothetical protein